MHRFLFALVLAACSLPPALGQECPQSSKDGPSAPSEVRALEGTMIYHDSIRQWFELKFDKPDCRQASIQLLGGDKLGTHLEVLRGCRVRTTGQLDISGTGYFSLDTFQSVQTIVPVGQCVAKPAFPDYSRAKPEKSIRAFRVDMHFDYEPGDHPIVFRVTSAGKELRPWQAYASYWLTGGFVLYGECAKGFVVDRVIGPPQANPSHFDERRTTSDMAAFDPESAAASGHKILDLAYTCVRSK
ncbi:MAG: hypothetical protein ABSE46_19745 [Terracidiphilus sp.]